MFRKLRSAQHMRITRTDSTVTIAFKGRAARIAEVHHFGLRDKPTPKSRRAVKYPARPLLGWSSEDRSALEALIVNHVAAGLNQGDTE
jgi:phage virion morphogenesis protein